jgi:hypothetical protein
VTVSVGWIEILEEVGERAVIAAFLWFQQGRVAAGVDLELVWIAIGQVVARLIRRDVVLHILVDRFGNVLDQLRIQTVASNHSGKGT